MAKRLVRTRQKIVGGGHPVPDPRRHRTASRLTGVCGVVHALYTAGHAPLGGAAVVDVDGCAEAIRLGPADPRADARRGEPTALMGAVAADRVPADRPDNAAGEVVVLAEQDRSRWDAGAVAEGTGVGQ